MTAPVIRLIAPLRTRVMLAWLAVLGCSVSVSPARAQDRIHLHTNETDLGEAARDGGVTFDEPRAVLAALLRNLPDRVIVYPSENYFYFRFMQNGVVISGNLRLAAGDRDDGKVHLAYGERPTNWNPEPKVRHVILGASQGVTVEKTGALIYRINHADRAVVFELNDLSKITMPAALMRPDERLIGPVFDESGIHFFLVFNERLRLFHYLLDETVPVADQFDTKEGGAIKVGKRTGFAFFEHDGRKILVGVDERESRLNTEFDGPFDQLPENIIEGDQLRAAMIASDPSAKDRIDRFGHFSDGSGRFLIHPYMAYRKIADLAVFARCAASKAVPVANRAACFVIDDAEALRPNPQPRALKKR